MSTADLETIRTALGDAYTDLSQWMQLADYQREKSARPSHDPLCATDAGFERTRLVQRQLGNAMRLVLDELEVNEKTPQAVSPAGS